MENILQIAQIVTAILLVIAVLMQNSGAGLGSAFGGESSIKSTKRGAERGIFITTIVLAILFLGLTLLDVFVN
ncbi:MAG: preprotein translocase subunit SecG [Parcubacteria group bacterium CG1_02_37_51]|uniref:Protein-export membrane protein SecG n=2 Tax=Candidatus Komeiliibacteriota TaxID=1817908 RepID=A0A2M8DRX4_9BACT|nr:MAG: preprotein translocase subunit SecG [Parcubacteria group bacterium CG1_02_37_51]PIY95228.1 MAG: preprotein translocase subunit SecG [Candidatus Komeilibacteria bacterium CG_4_10_14_0_8_um_filter_37_78]PJC02088.1 MAG: preprotein translocase subunit SecG [Candidatus Komeilibacteria bacterium CG_4_9_14_0_8_um_filter_36_9]